MDQFAGISLKTRLYLLVLAAFIPVALLIVYVAEEQKAIEKDAILHKVTLMAQSAAEAESLQMEAARSLMASLGEAFQLVDGQPQQLTRFLSGLHHRAEAYAAFGLIDPKGQLIAGSRPSLLSLTYGERTWFTTSLKLRRLTIEPYRGEQIDGKPVLYLAEPVVDSRGVITAVAFAAIDLNRMNRSLFKQLTELPAGSRLTLMDEDQVLLRYTVDTGRWSAAQPFDPALQRQIKNKASGIEVATDETGMPRIYAYAQLESTFQPRRIAVVLEIPESVALAASKRIFVRNLALLAALALLAVFAIWWAANVFILRRVAAMVQASRRLAAGDFQARIGHLGMHDELSHLAGVFDEMAQTLQMRIEREEQAKASLEQSREQLRRLGAYQNDIREQERIRIAREIHDQLGQSLTILKMDLTWLRKHMPPGDRLVDEKMEAMVRFIREAMETLHAVTAELRPVILDDFGLAAAIEWQIDAFRHRSGIDCRLENNGFEPDLPTDQATAIFRIFQELLTNIIRHAQADEVIVRLEKHDGEMMLQVDDNGRGITAEEINSPHAFGLLGIRERLNPLGGRVVFKGRPGEGTRVIIHLPLTEEGSPP